MYSCLMARDLGVHSRSTVTMTKIKWFLENKQMPEHWSIPLSKSIPIVWYQIMHVTLYLVRYKPAKGLVQHVCYWKWIRDNERYLLPRCSLWMSFKLVTILSETITSGMIKDFNMWWNRTIGCFSLCRKEKFIISSWRTGLCQLEWLSWFLAMCDQRCWAMKSQGNLSVGRISVTFAYVYVDHDLVKFWIYDDMDSHQYLVLSGWSWWCQGVLFLPSNEPKWLICHRCYGECTGCVVFRTTVGRVLWFSLAWAFSPVWIPSNGH